MNENVVEEEMVVKQRLINSKEEKSNTRESLRKTLHNIKNHGLMFIDKTFIKSD